MTEEPVGDGDPSAAMNETARAFDTLRKALQDDPDYAWGWHCNIAMAFYDVGGDRDLIDEAASLFMKRTFGVTTEKHPGSKK